ncbi:Spastin [Hordeum vulgare]|nr:Spastin [Hordeum vulgare]
MTAAASWKEAALQVLVVTVVLPLATYPVYAFALDCGQAQGGCPLLLGSLYGYLLPSAGVQLYSAVAATVFYHRCMEQQRHELAIPVTMKAMKLDPWWIKWNRYICYTDCKAPRKRRKASCLQSEQTRVVLTSAAYVNLKQAEISKYTRNLAPANRVILLSGPAGKPSSSQQLKDFA